MVNQNQRLYKPIYLKTINLLPLMLLLSRVPMYNSLLNLLIYKMIKLKIYFLSLALDKFLHNKIV